jgi:hypothetical protein
MKCFKNILGRLIKDEDPVCELKGIKAQWILAEEDEFEPFHP